MELATFNKFLEEARELAPEYIHLQGWGEPLLHPKFEEFVKKASNVSEVGITTNATLIEAKIETVVSLDIVAVTFAGARQDTHDKYRVGCPFHKVVENSRKLAKRKQGKLTAIYMLFQDNYRELQDFIDLAEDIGFDNIVVSNVNYLPNVEVARVKAFTDFFEKTNLELVKAIDKASEKAKQRGIRFLSDFVAPKELVECPEQPTNTVFINVYGEVSPCVYLSLPTLDGKIPRVFNGRNIKISKVIYGKIGEKPLKKIINTSKNNFSNKFIYRKYNLELGNPAEPPDVCLSCYRLYGV